jgi:hypothetical protein
MKTIIHHGFSRRWLGLELSLVAAMAVQAQTLVTFQVDMSSYNGGTPPAGVTINGSFNGWGSPGSPALSTSAEPFGATQFQSPILPAPLKPASLLQMAIMNLWRRIVSSN